MNQNQQLIEEFYAAFASQNTNTMASCYHKDIKFQDPVFENLEGKNVMDMWKMLIERSKGNMEIKFLEIEANNVSGSAKWIAIYHFSITNRKVVNIIQANFEFKDGLIINHVDHFNIWKWSKQAFGLKGLFLGWTSFMQKKIQAQAKLSLSNYQKKHIL